MKAEFVSRKYVSVSRFLFLLHVVETYLQAWIDAAIEIDQIQVAFDGTLGTEIYQDSFDYTCDECFVHCHLALVLRVLWIVG